MQKKPSISEHTSRLLTRFEELWQNPYELSFDTLKRLITDLPEESRVFGIETLAEYLVNAMKLHFLDIVAIFHQKAEEEGIDERESAETISDVMPEAFQMLQNIGSQLSVHSVEGLLILANITFGLYALSEVESAEEAQRWMYKLPKIYRNRLDEEHLIVAPAQLTVTISTTSTGFSVPWQKALSLPSEGWLYYQQQSIVQTQSSTGKQSISLVA